MWDSDDSPSFNELLLCTFVRFALFMTKQEIFEKGEKKLFFSKRTSFTATEIYTIIVEASFPKPQVKIT